MNHRHPLLLLTGLILLLLGGCAINPASGLPNLVFMSEDKEIGIGRGLHDKILESTPIYQDPQLQAYVDRIGQTLAKNSDRADLTYTFTIIDSPDINAFALPGGYIYINRGLLAYLNSEAQLAAVLAHEIGHVTARHAVKQDTARKSSTAVTVLSVLTTGNSMIGDVTDLWGTAAVMGYGREMELDADSLGAKYLHNSGYNPNAMIEVIGVLKDHERFVRRMARETGQKGPATYHGVFATHPRNDERLKEVVGTAGKLTHDASGVDNRDAFREATEGLLYGINPNPQTAAAAQNNTYSHSRLGFSVDFPPRWQVENQQSQIVATAPDGHAQMTIEVALLQTPVAPDVYIREQLKVPLLQQSQAFSQYGLIGHTGILPASASQPHPGRLAVLYQGRRVYILRGSVDRLPATAETTTAEPAASPDELFMASIRSFRPSQTARKTTAQSRSLHYVKANEQTTFKRLSEVVPLGNFVEEQLRLLNGHYPRGEPGPGEWLKIVR